VDQDRGLSAEQLSDKYGSDVTVRDEKSEHPVYSVWDWIQEVAQRSTRRGYWDWVWCKINDEWVGE